MGEVSGEHMFKSIIINRDIPDLNASQARQGGYASVQAHPAHPVGRQEPVLDPVAERVLVHRIAEVTVRVSASSLRIGVAVSPIYTASSKCSKIRRRWEDELALPRWHSSTMIRSR